MNAIHRPVQRQVREGFQLRPLVLALFCVSMASLPNALLAQVTVAAGNTRVFTAPNGVPVVDIATPNGAGVSHNVFSDFNVAHNGLVLNNGNSAQLSRQSQLAGQTLANLNLDKSATLILNEVTSTNRSTLAGYVEVLGAKADVVIANPNGITCNGCGFLNTPRVTLTTATAKLDAGGNLGGLAVAGGDILVNGTGLNGSGLDYLDLVARSVRLDGPVNASDLGIVAGLNNWDYATRSATTIAVDPASGAPALGIDSSALGGMYANRIRLLSTEHGVGVRLLGDAAAAAADLTLTASGQIELRGHVGAKAGNVTIDGLGAAGAIAVQGAGASVSAAHDVRLTTQDAAIQLTDASLAAGGNLQVQAGGTLTDATSAGSSSAPRFGAASTTVTAGGAATVDGSTWGAGGALNASAGALAIGAGGAVFYSGSDASAAHRELSIASNNGDLQLGAARVMAPGGLSMAASSGITLDAAGRVESGSDMSVTAGGRVGSAGTMLAAGALALHAGDIDNQGAMQSGGAFRIEASSGVANDARGAMVAGGALDLRAQAVDNAGVIQSEGALGMAVDDRLTNTGRLLSQADVVVRGTRAGFRVDNDNLIQAGASVRIGSNANEAGIVNGAGASLAGADVTLAATSLSNLGLIQGDHGVQVSARGDVAVGSAGAVLADGKGAALSFDVGGRFRNEGGLQADGAVTLHALGAILNSGTLVAQTGQVTVSTADALTNSGTLAALAGPAIVSAAGTLANSGIVAAVDSLGVVTGADLINSGTLQSHGTLTAQVATALTNAAAGKLLATGDMTLSGSGAGFVVDNLNRIESGGALRLGGTTARADLHEFHGASLLANTVDLMLETFVNEGSLQSAGSLRIDAFGRVSNLEGAIIATTGNGPLGVQARGRLDNAGHLQSSGTLALSTSDVLHNSGSIVTLASADGGSNGKLQVQADVLDNAGSLAAAGAASVSAGRVVNEGTLQSAGALTATVAETITNTGDLLTGGALDILSNAAGFAVTNANRVQSAGDVTVGSVGHLANFANGNGGLFLAGGRVSLTTGTFDNGNVVQAGKGLSVASAGRLTNAGTGQILARAGDVALQSGGNLDNQGTVEASQGMALEAAGQLSNSGVLQALAGGLNEHASRITNTASGFMWSSDALGLNVDASLVNDGKLVAGGDLRVVSDSASFTVTNSNLMQSAGTLSVGSADHRAALANQGQGVLLGDTASLNLSTLSNAWTVQGTRGLMVDAGGDVDNLSGASLQTGQLDGDALTLRTRGTLVNDGTLVAKGDLSIGAGQAIDNRGTVAADGAATVTAGTTIGNSGTIQAMHSLHISAGSGLANAALANLVSGADMRISAGRGAFTFDNAGLVQAATALTLDGAAGAASVLNRGGGSVVGGQVSLSMDWFDNYGTVQGSTLALSSAGRLLNEPRAKLLNDGGSSTTMSLRADSIGNAGIVESNGALSVNARTVTNSGKLDVVPAVDRTAGGLLSVATDESFDNASSGQVAAGGALTVSAKAFSNEGSISSLGSASVQIQGIVNAGTFASAGDLSITSPAADFSVDNSGTLSSGGRLSVGTSTGRAAVHNTREVVGGSVAMFGSTLQNSGSASQLLSANGMKGAVDLDFGGAITNEGALHADGDLTMTGARVTNSSDGGISARESVHLTATGGDIDNAGWLFALNAGMTLKAVGHDIANRPTGNIEAPAAGAGTLVFDTGPTGSFTNNNYISAGGALTVITGDFRNQPAVALPAITKHLTYLGENVAKGGALLGDSGDYNCTGTGVFKHDCQHSRVHQYDYEETQEYSFAFNPSAVKRAQLISTGNIEIDYAKTAANNFSVIAGSADVTINAAAGAQAFQNNDLHRETTEKRLLVFNYDGGTNANLYPVTEAQYKEVENETSWQAWPAGWVQYANGNAAPETVRDELYKAYLNPQPGTPSPYYQSGVPTPNAADVSAGIYAKGTFNLHGSIKLLAAKPDPTLPGSERPAPSGDPTPVATTSPTSPDPANPLGAARLSPTGQGPGSPDRVKPNPHESLPVIGALPPGTPAGLSPVLSGGVPSGITTAVGANGVAFIGPDLSVPSSPNGLYVVAPANETHYLVETNPLFGAGGAVGSNFLAERLGYDPAVIEKRLGDANYETRLVHDELVAQTNNFLLAGYTKESDQMAGLMMNAASEAGTLGLTLGKALTPEQASKLTADLVWMVEAHVDGQKVLAPVVYLSAKTRDSVLTGSVIAAHDVHIDGGTVSNAGGTIVATNAVDIVTQGDITNTGGAIRGNSIALTSVTGNVINQTAAEFHGDAGFGRTSIGPTGTIVAKHDLDISAAKDVKVIGATVAAGGNVSLAAGHDVVLDAIVNKSVDSSGGSSGDGRNGSSWNHKETDSKQIGSTLSSGGNLTIKSKNDVTIADSHVKVGGDLSIDAARDVNVVDRQDTHQTIDTVRTVSSGVTAKGSSVGYAVTESSSTTTTRIGTSVGSSIETGGNADLSAGNTLAVRGSDVAAKGDLAVKATDVKMLAGQNTFDQTIDSKTSTTGATVGVDIKAISDVVNMAKSGKPSAADIARAGADAYGNQAVSVGVSATSTTSHSQESDTTARVSTLTSGGQTSVSAKNKATFEGTQVNAGEDIVVKARDIDMVAAQDTSSYVTHSDTTGLNVSVSADPTALARKAAADNVYSGGGGGVTLATASNTQRDSTDTGNKSVVSTFNAGGSIKRTASGTLTDQGSQLTAAKDVTQSAATINLLAAADQSSHEESQTTNSASIGVSVDFKPKQAYDDIKKGKPGTALGLLSGPTMGADANFTHDASSSGSQSSTAHAGTIAAGGNILSTSSGATTLQGTQLLSGADTRVTAATLDFQAARNTQSSHSGDRTITADGRVQVDMKGTPGGSVAAGYTTSTSDSSSSQAVSGAINAGGNLRVTTKGDATFEGTQLGAGHDASVSAGGSVDMKTADSTANASSSQWGVRGGVNTSASGAKGANVAVTVSSSSSDSSTAHAGSVHAGNDVSIVSSRDVTLAGTSIDAGKDASVAAVGNLDVLAARSSSSSEHLGVGAGVGVARADKSQGVSAQVSVDRGDAHATTEEGAAIAGGNRVTLRSGGSTLLQGTQVDGAAVAIESAGTLTKQDAVSTSSSSGLQVSAYAQVAGKRDGGAQDGGAATRPRSNAVSEDQAPPQEAAPESQSAPAASAFSRAKDSAAGALDAASTFKKTHSGAVAYASKSDSSDSSSTAVDIRQGSDARSPATTPPQIDQLKTLPAVKSAVQIGTALASALAQYGSNDAIPATVKRTILVQAGVTIPSGADLDQLLARTRAAGVTAAKAGLAGAGLDAHQQAAALSAIGVGQ